MTKDQRAALQTHRVFQRLDGAVARVVRAAPFNLRDDLLLDAGGGFQLLLRPALEFARFSESESLHTQNLLLWQ